MYTYYYNELQDKRRQQFFFGLYFCLIIIIFSYVIYKYKVLYLYVTCENIKLNRNIYFKNSI